MFKFQIEGLPDTILKGKKITISNGSFVVQDIATGRTITWDNFIKENLGEIRDYRIDLIFQD